MGDRPFSDDETPPRRRETPPERPSAKPTPPTGPPEWSTPTPKPAPLPSAPRPSAPLKSPRPSTLLSRADEIEMELQPDWANKTNPGIPRDVWNRGSATNGYANTTSKRYASWAAAIAVGFQLFTQTVPMLVDLYEKHLDRQAARAAMKQEAR